MKSKKNHDSKNNSETINLYERKYWRKIYIKRDCIIILKNNRFQIPREQLKSKQLIAHFFKSTLTRPTFTFFLYFLFSLKYRSTNMNKSSEEMFMVGRGLSGGKDWQYLIVFKFGCQEGMCSWGLFSLTLLKYFILFEFTHRMHTHS